MAHAQEEFMGRIAILFVERVLFHNLLDDILDLISSLDLILVLVDEQRLEPFLINPNEHSLEATQLLRIWLLFIAQSVSIDL